MMSIPEVDAGKVCCVSGDLDFPKLVDPYSESTGMDSAFCRDHVEAHGETAGDSHVGGIENVMIALDSNSSKMIDLVVDEKSVRNVLEYSSAPSRASPADFPLVQSDSGALILEGGNSNEIDECSALCETQSKSEARFLMCGFCKNNPLTQGSTPKLLPCLHSFCESCLLERYETQRKAAGNQNPRLKCPLCGQEFLVAGIDKPTSGFLDNQFIIESAISHTNCKHGENQCTSCDDKSAACSYCLNCNEWLCDACVDAHKRVKVTKDHTIEAEVTHDNKIVVSSSANSKEKPLFCKVHPQEQLKLFCGPCDKLTCRDCQLTEHKEHRYQFIEEAAGKHRDTLGKLLQYLQINLGLLKETIADVQKSSDAMALQEKDLEMEINKAFEVLMAAVKNRQQVLVNELKSLVVSKQSLLAKQKKDLMQMRIILEHNHDFSEFAVKGGSNVALLYCRKVLGTRLHNLNSLKYRQRPLACQDLKFSMDADKLCSYFSKSGAVYSQEDMQRKIEFYNGSNSQRTAATGVGRSQSSSFFSAKQPGTPVDYSSKRVPDVLSTDTAYINLNSSGAGCVNNRRPHASSPCDSSSRRASSSGSSSHLPPNMMVLTSQSSGIKLPDSAGLSKAELTAKYIQHLKESAARKQDSYNSAVLKSSSNHGLPLSSKIFHHSLPVSSGFGNTLASPPPRRPLQVASTGWGRPPSGASIGSTINELQRLVNAASRQNPVVDTIQTSHPQFKPGGHSPVLSNIPTVDTNSVVIKQEDGEIASYVFPLSSSSSQDDARSGESGFDENQANEDYCGVCRNGGQLLCCDTCPKVYHLQCHIPALAILPNDSWSCGLCLALASKGGSLQKRSISSDVLTESEVKVCEKILLHLFVHADSLPFHHKVSKAQVPDYYKVISKPMDLTTIRSKIQSQNFAHYKSLDEYIADVRLVFSNCYVYNAPESDVYMMGLKLESYFETLLNAHAPVYAGAAVETEPPAKRRRDSRSTLDEMVLPEDL